jgi:alanyl-tRNA synthetase
MNSNLNNVYIISDHIRASCFIIADGVTPSGKQRGYILRRLIRRSLSSSLKLGIDISNRSYFDELVNSVCTIYSGVYDQITENKDLIVDTIYLESQKYLKAISVGASQWDKFLAK